MAEHLCLSDQGSRRAPVDPRPDGPAQLLSRAKRATLELFDGAIHSVPPDEPELYSVTSFKRLEEEIDVESLFAPYCSEKRVREKDIRELLSGVKGSRRPGNSKRKGGSREACLAARAPTRQGRGHGPPSGRNEGMPRPTGSRSTRSSPCRSSASIFVLVGIPLGTTTRKGGRTSGFTISLGIILVYYILITAGEKMAMDGQVSPFLGMWGPNSCSSWPAAYSFPGPLRETASFLGCRRVPEEERKKSPGSGPRRRAGAPEAAAALPPLSQHPRPLHLRKYLAIFALVFLALLSISVIVTFFERIDNIYEHDKSLRAPPSLHPVPHPRIRPLHPSRHRADDGPAGPRAPDQVQRGHGHEGLRHQRLPADPARRLYGRLRSSLFSFALQERLLPPANNKAEETWNRINDRPPRSYSFLDRHWVLSRKKDRIYHYSYFDPGPSVFSQLSVFDIDLAVLGAFRRIYAEKARLKEDSSAWSRLVRGAFQGAAGRL